MKWSQRISVVAGNAMEFYDIAVFAAISGTLAIIFENQGVNHGQETVWGIFALRFLVRPFGGLVIARYAKKNGRKSALILTSTLTGVATFLMAFMPVNAAGIYLPVLFLILQMVQAFSFGGEYPTIINYLHSEGKENEQGRISAIIVGSSLIGVIFSALIVLVLKEILTPQQMLEFGWRIPLVLGGINILLSFYFRTRLPYQLPTIRRSSASLSHNATAILNVFLITVPGAVVFYIQNMASNILGDVLMIGFIKPFFPIINAALLFLAVIIIGFVVDKYSRPEKFFNLGILLLCFFAVPLYALLTHSQLAIAALATILLSIISALILANLAAVTKSRARGDDSALGLGYNLALSIFGGMTPAIISWLTPYGLAFAGLYAALSTLPYFITNLSPSFMNRTSDDSTS